jgi:dTMP kinase
VKRGKLIAFEGVDGSGKSTQIGLLAEALRERGLPVETTFEPTNGATGKRIRAMAQSNERVLPALELEWFVTDRREHVDQMIEPALASGSWVITDRYTLSSVAYQGARGLSPDQILRDSESEFPLPDLALILEIGVDEGLARVRARPGVAEPAFENREFLAAASEIFASLDRHYIERIDGRGEPAVVHSRVVPVMARLLARSTA